MKTIGEMIKLVLLLGGFSTAVFSQEVVFNDAFLNSYDIVLLGEETHGDGAVFEKKLAMVKELHEKGGFNLLAFESGMYDIFKANQLYNEGKEDIEIFKESVGYLWSETQVFQDLLEYMKTHPKLKIFGFDSQEDALFGEYFLEDFKLFCARNNIIISNETYLELEKVLVVRDLQNYAKEKQDSTSFYNKMQVLENKIDLISEKNQEEKILTQTFKSVLSDLDYSLKDLRKEKIYVQNPRDKQMAENFIFLREQFPEEKLIGWGASYHFANRLNEFEYTVVTENHVERLYSLIDSIAGHNEINVKDQIEEIKDLKFAKPMGQILKDKYGDKLFSLAFTSYEGYYYNFVSNKEYPILKPPANSIEAILKKQGAKEKLEILKKQNNNTKFYASVLGYIPVNAYWKNIFDGIYYIEKMYPPIYMEYDDSVKDKLVVKNNLSSVTGTILDNETSEQIVYADIYYSNSNISTVSNSNGQFSVPNSNKVKSYLIFSAIGYESDSIQVQKIKENNIIYLIKVKNDIILNEVIVTAKAKVMNAKEIIEKARNNIEINYVQSPYNQSFFFTFKESNTNDSIVNIEEALIETYNKKGVNGSNRVEKGFFGKIKNLRNNTDRFENKRWNNGVGTLWVVLNKDIILSKSNVLYRTASYDLTKSGIRNYNGRKVYEIHFINNSPGAYSTGYGYPAPESSNGTIYVDTENYAVLKYEHCIKRAEFVSKKSKNIIKYEHKIVQSYKKVEEKYFMNLLEVKTKTKVYSPGNKYLNTYYKAQKLVSSDIETNTLSVIKRPLIDLRKGFRKIDNDPFWLDKPLNLKSNIPIANLDCN